MRRVWVILAGIAVCVGAGSSSGGASPLAPLGPVLDRQEASPVEIVRNKKGKRKKFRRVQKFGGRYYIVERRRNGGIRVMEAYPLYAVPHRLERRQGRVMANRDVLEQALRHRGRDMRRDPGTRVPSEVEPRIAARPKQLVEPSRPEPQRATPMPKPEAPEGQFEDFEATPDEAELEPNVASRPDPQALAREAPEGEPGADASVSCEAAADVVTDFGFSEVETTSCSGELYEFAAKRDGMAYSIKVNPADGELAEVQKQ